MKKPGLTTKEIMLKGTIIALIVTIPSLISFFLVWTITDNLIYGGVSSVIVHFIAMGFSLKISKKLLVKKDS
jgi:hypothetical protein